MLDRKKFIKHCLNTFIPSEISNLINEYDYYIVGNCELSIQAESHDNILCCAILSEGKELRLVSGTSQHTLKIWSVDLNNMSYKCEQILRGHESWIICCAILSNNSLDYYFTERTPRLVSGSDDCTLKIWNLQSGECELTLRGHTWDVDCCAVLTDGRILSGSADNTLKIWNYDGKCDITLEGHSGSVFCCAVLPDGRIVSGSADGTLKIWNAKTGKCESTIRNDSIRTPNRNDTGGIMCCAVLPNSEELKLVYGVDNVLKIMNLQTKKCELILKGFASWNVSCAILPDGRILGTSDDNTLKIWNAQTGTSSHSSGTSSHSSGTSSHSSGTSFHSSGTSSRRARSSDQQSNQDG
jgi:WD40 repeat protein